MEKTMTYEAKTNIDNQDPTFQVVTAAMQFIRAYEYVADQMSLIQRAKLSFKHEHTKRLDKLINDYKTTYKTLKEKIQDPISKLTERIQLQEEKLVLQSKPELTENEKERLKELEKIEGTNIVEIDSEELEYLLKHLPSFFNKLGKIKFKQVQKDVEKAKKSLNIPTETTLEEQ